MDINYNKRYAYSEVYSILNWLGEGYIRKVPKNLLQTFKLERKFGYEPNIDFSKPLEDQVLQETKNIIAYLEYHCWLEDPKEKEELKKAVEENAKKAKEEKRLKRQAQLANCNESGNMPLNVALDDAIGKLNK